MVLNDLCFLPLLGMIETAQVDERAKGNGSSQPGAARRGVQIIDDEPQILPALITSFETLKMAVIFSGPQFTYMLNVGNNIHPNRFTSCE